MKRSSSKWHFWIPLLLLLVLTPWLSTLDLKISRYFYREGAFASHPLFETVYKYGIWPAWLATIAALFLLIGSFFIPTWKRWRSNASILILTLAVGSGLIVHALLKDHWGRPRPRQIAEFGGSQLFRPYYQPQLALQPEPSKSFPSGHSSVGFFFFALAAIGWREGKRWLYYAGLMSAFGLGGLLSLTRIAQGGHFLSDTFVSALIMWLTAFTLAKILPRQ